MKKPALLVLLVVLIALPAAAVAGGATTTTTTYDIYECDNETGPGPGYCYTDKGVWHQTETPSGNVNTEQNGKYTLTGFRDGVLSFYEEASYHNVYHTKDGAIQVRSPTCSIEIEYSDGTICTSEYDYHYVNGVVIRNDSEYVCY